MKHFYKRYLLLVILFLGALSSSAQKLRVGSSLVSAGVNFGSYSAKATNLSTLTAARGSLPALAFFGMYNYQVTDHISLRAEGAYDLYAALATGYDLGVGVEYHIRFKRKNPVDMFVALDGGYTHLYYKSGLLTVGGTFKSPGIYYGAGLGIRKSFGNFGIFADLNYVIHNYSGGEVINSDNVKMPYTINFSGLNYGGGICWRLAFGQHLLIE